MKICETPGPLMHHAIRRARKSYQCDGWTNPRGHATINPGDEYIEGDPQPDRAGGYGFLRYCAQCCAKEISEAGLQ